jgi:hypothetical protein
MVRMRGRLVMATIPATVTALAGRGAGQGPFVPFLPATDLRFAGLGGTRAATAAAQADLWRHLLAFLDDLPRAPRLG